MRLAARLALLFGLWFASFIPANAQYGGQGGTPGSFDFYVLSLSWSPGWCTVQGDNKGSEQCRPGTGYGFVLHGLWPQYDRDFPSNCSAVDRSPTRAAMDIATKIYPEQGLARYEWRKHGTCSGLDPRAYFQAAETAKEKVVVPEAFKAPTADQTTSSIDVMRAFNAANPGLRPGMIAVTCSRGLLEEVRVCLSKDLRDFVPCPEVSRKACRSRSLTVPAVR